MQSSVSPLDAWRCKCLIRRKELPVTETRIVCTLIHLLRFICFPYLDIRCVQEPVLVFDEEVAGSFMVVTSMKIQIGHSREVDSHVREFVQALCEFFEIPFETSKMRADEFQVGMLFEHVVAGVDLILIRREFGMEVHVVFWMITVVSFMENHGVERKPAFAWFAKVADQRNVVGREVIQDGIKPRIIDHHKLSIFIAQVHAYVLPDFHCNSTLRE